MRLIVIIALVAGLGFLVYKQPWRARPDIRVVHGLATSYLATPTIYCAQGATVNTVQISKIEDHSSDAGGYPVVARIDLTCATSKGNAVPGNHVDMDGAIACVAHKTSAGWVCDMSDQMKTALKMLINVGDALKQTLEGQGAAR